jgi:hypothetical protein
VTKAELPSGFAHYEMMSASLLSQQPIVLPDTQKETKNWRRAFSHFEARLNSLRMWRYRIWAHWAELAKYILPRRYHWLIVANRMDKGAQINDAIVDGTATLAMQVCASGLWTGLTSPSRPWFKLEKALPWIELDQDAKEWIEDTQQRIYTVLGKSNVYTILAQAFQDVVVFGTAPVILYEDYKDVVRAYLPCAGEYFLASSARLSNDTLYREFTLTVEGIVGQFGAENCPDAVLKLWRAGRASLDQEFVVAHAIQPNFAFGDGGDEFRMVPSSFPYVEVYWLRGMATEKPLSVRGFDEKPFFDARWATTSNDPYGRSIGMDALPDVKQLQLETKRKGEFIDKGVRPPMGADVSLKNEPSSIISGQVTYIPTGSLAGAQHGFFPLFMPQPQWLQGITADIETVKKRIETAFFVDVFMAITRMEGVQPRNELELTKRDLERLQVLGPFIEQFETEFAGPLIQRVFNILVKRKMLRPPPPSMRGVPLKIDYVSIMKLAQRSAELVAMKDVLGTAGALSSAAKAAGQPDPIRVINLDKSMRKYADLGGFPSDCLYTDKEVQTNDQIHMKAHQDQAAMQQSMAAVQAAHTLSQTSTGPDNALSALLGRGGSQQGTPAGVTGSP